MAANKCDQRDRPPTIHKKIENQDETEKAMEREKSRKERDKHYNNIKEILACSNATPIRSKCDDGYACCYCPNKYLEPANLKRHTLDAHKKCNIKEASFMSKANINAFHVKIDITGLRCNICDEEINTLELLLEHLKKIHKKRIYTDVNNRMLPFKFYAGSELSCCMCSSVFIKFKALLEHMNVHYRNFICEICDAGFVTRTMAVTHTNIHKTGIFNCGYCEKVFNTSVKKSNHERTVHTHAEKQNRCGFCDKTFKYYHQKLKHLSEIHGVGNRAKCQACDRIFESQRKLRVHVRKVHLMERKYKCSHCDMKFFSGSELHDHMVKHTGLKEYQCSVCLKSFGRKKTLNVHMKVHAHDRT